MGRHIIVILALSAGLTFVSFAIPRLLLQKRRLIVDGIIVFVSMSILLLLANVVLVPY